MKILIDMSGPRNLAAALANLAAAHNVEPGKWVKFSTTYKVLTDGSIQAEDVQLIEVGEPESKLRDELARRKARSTIGV